MSSKKNNNPSSQVPSWRPPFYLKSDIDLMRQLLADHDDNPVFQADQIRNTYRENVISSLWETTQSFINDKDQFLVGYFRFWLTANEAPVLLPNGKERNPLGTRTFDGFRLILTPLIKDEVKIIFNSPEEEKAYFMKKLSWVYTTLRKYIETIDLFDAYSVQMPDFQYLIVPGVDPTMDVVPRIDSSVPESVQAATSKRNEAGS
jgi:hypothetical protein